MDQTNAHGNAMAAMAGSGIFLLITAVILIFSVLIYWRIATKAGYSGALSLLLFVPLVNLVVILIFAFSEWPIEKKLKALGGGAPGVPWTPQPVNPPSTI